MIKREEVYKIGLFNKPHGIHGELLFTFTDDIFDRADSDYLICLIDGIFVPFFIEEYRFRSDTSALIKLENVNTAEAARMFTNIEVYFPVKYAKESAQEELTWEYFIGFSMQTTDGDNLGEISAIDAATANILFVIEHSKGELLIPAHEEFITGIDHARRILTVSLPEGLLTLDE